MSVYSFGWSKYGQLGLGANVEDHLVPTVISALKGKRILSVNCGESHSVAVTEFGDLYTWGRGREGQMGLGDRSNQDTPQLVEKLSHERIMRACSGNYHTAAVSDAGRVYTWGKIHKLNDESETVYDEGGNVEMPGMTEDSEDKIIAGVSLKGQLRPNGTTAGERVRAMIDRSQMQYLSGGNPQEFDDMQVSKEYSRFSNYTQPTPLLMEALRGKRVIEIAAGFSYTAVITDMGQMYTWGINEKGQLGLGHRFNTDTPRLVIELQGTHMVGVACGSHHTVALSEDGKVYTCGLGVFGQLGHGNLRDLLVPKLVQTLVDAQVTVVQLTCGSYHSVARSDKGQLYSWGHGEYGQHGGVANYNDWAGGENAKDSHLYYSLPRVLGGFDGLKIVHIACGQLHTIAITDTSLVYSWGWGASGCLGHGDKRYQLVPRHLSALQGEEISCASAGWKHSLVVKSGTSSTFAFDFRQMINNPKYCDITFIVQDKPVLASRILVLARCPYLKKLLLIHSRFVGTGSFPDQLVIKGIRHPIFMALILYIYTDHMIVAPHLVRELADEAKRFELPRLEALCKRAGLRAWRSKEDAVVIPQTTFSRELRTLVNNPLLADISWKIGATDVVSAHRMALAARTPYFQRMFEGSFREKDQQTFVIDDGTSAQSFTCVLDFLYTGDPSIVQAENAVEILSIADRFMIQDLKEICESFLERTVSSLYTPIIERVAVDGTNLETSSTSSDEDNEDYADACENTLFLLEAGDSYHARRLKRVCLETLALLGPEGWKFVRGTKAYAEAQPRILSELDYLCSTVDSLTMAEKVQNISSMQVPLGSSSWCA